MGCTTTAFLAAISQPLRLNESHRRRQTQDAPLPLLRLGFHSASGTTNPAAAHGVSRAIAAIREEHGLNVTPIFRPVGFSELEALEAALDLIDDSVGAVVGGGASSISAVAQYAFGMAGVPQVAHSSTALVLSDKVSAPTFSRVVPPDSFQGTALANISYQLGWTRVAVISTLDEYAAGAAEVFVATMRQRDGASIVLERQFALPRGTSRTTASGGSTASDEAWIGTAVADAVHDLLASRVRVAALIVGSLWAARTLLTEVATQYREAGVPLPAFLGGEACQKYRESGGGGHESGPNAVGRPGRISSRRVCAFRNTQASTRGSRQMASPRPPTRCRRPQRALWARCPSCRAVQRMTPSLRAGTRRRLLRRPQVCAAPTSALLRPFGRGRTRTTQRGWWRRRGRRWHAQGATRPTIARARCWRLSARSR